MSASFKWPETQLQFSIPEPSMPEERSAALLELRWILACFDAGITESYAVGSPRQIEMRRKIMAFLSGMASSGKLTAEEYEEFSSRWGEMERPDLSRHRAAAPWLT